jgi:S1-C subfamily serine protease
MLSKKIVVLCSLVLSFASSVSLQGKASKAIVRLTAENREALAQWPDVFDDVKDAVVQIFSYATPFSFQTPFKKDALVRASGSGFFVRLQGSLGIITNYHVVDNADVIFLQHSKAWKECIELEFVGGSPEFDVALLHFKEGQQVFLEQKLAGQGIKVLELGDSDLVREGQEIMLIGYPLGEEHIKHAIGTISGHESIQCGECFTTTAAAFPGNSGGACVDRSGKVVGILVAGINSSQGLNYVLPISREKVVLDELKNGKVLERPFWGVSAQATTPATFAYLKVPGDGGLLITRVEDGSLAAQAGLQKNDVITAIIASNNRMSVDRFGYVNVPWSSYRMEFFDALGRIRYGDTMQFEYWRDGQVHMCSAVKSFENPLKIKRKFLPFDNEPAYEVFGGCVIMEFTMNHYINQLGRLKDYLKTCSPALAAFTKLLTSESRKEPRLVVTHVFPESTLAKNHVFEGPLDILESVNGQAVRTIDDFRLAMQKSLETGFVVFETIDGGLVALTLADVIAQELALSEKYNYQPSSVFLKMVM